MDQGRKDVRFTINQKYASFDQFIAEYVSNISVSGLFISTEEPLALGTSVDLCFTVVVDELATIRGEGVVVRVQTDPPGMGVKFRQLSSESEQVLQRLLARKGIAYE